MQPTHTNHEAGLDAASDAPASPRSHRRLIVIFCVLVVILLLTFIPPLINLSRFQLRIARNIGASLGRPVHFSRVSPVLLPMPGFTLEQFVVEEDPAFGSEPILRADQVRVTLRLSSLWRHAEFSRISLTDPSVNLVRNPGGRWNIEGVLLQASHMQAAPTSQPYSGPARRFPYIEATGARLNLKLGPEKTPFSLTDADFALWLPEPHQWHLRLEAHPLRTDTEPGDTGTLRVEGTLGGAGGASSLAEIPIDLHGDWSDVQLGGLSRLLFASDSGLRGDFSITFGILGTVGQNAIATTIHLAKARRADFIPDHLLTLEASCNTIAENSFQSFPAIECHWPPAGSSSPSLLLLTANLPDARNPRTASVKLTIPALPAGTFFDWLGIATRYPPRGFTGSGVLAGSIAWDPAVAQPSANPKSPAPQPAWSGNLDFSGESLNLPALGPDPIPLGDIVLRSTPRGAERSATQSSGPGSPLSSFDLQPISLPLGGKLPATLEGRFDGAGCTLHLTGTVVAADLLALAVAVPQFGEGLQQILDKIADAPRSAPSLPASTAKPGRPSAPTLTTAPIHVDLTATRAWGGPQTWTETAPPPPRHPVRR